MKNRIELALAVAVIGGSMSGCNRVNDGDILTVSRDTNCYQCPGGDKLSDFEKVYDCAKQRDYGIIPKNSEVTVTINESDYFLDKGYYRVSGQVLNPVTGKRTDMVCWADGRDLNKK